MGGLSPIHWLILTVLLLIVVFGLRPMVRLISRSSSGPSTPTVPPQTGRPRAGWYPDQQDPVLVRWHDGYQWTAYTQPRQKR